RKRGRPMLTWKENMKTLMQALKMPKIVLQVEPTLTTSSCGADYHILTATK
ncbi:hypothetical protein L9F63_028027, partial [Diploptera punctata]